MRNTTVLSLALQPLRLEDARKLEEGLRRLRAEDPAVDVQVNKETGQVIVGATCDQHLETIIDRLKREFHVNAACGRPQVRYKETITAPAAGQMKYARQIGSRGEYAHVKLRLSPGEQGSGCIIKSTLVEGAIPQEFLPAIVRGIRQACMQGVLSGFPIDDVRVELYDGSYHEVDSSSFAFTVAAAMALQEGASQASPVLLEPIMRVDVSVPAEDATDVVDNISRRRGEICSRQDLGGAHVVRARVPVAELFGYESDLHVRTHGRATCAIEFDGYQPVPAGDGPDDPASVVVGLPKGPRPRSFGASVPEPDA